jgi:hypothetical protein
MQKDKIPARAAHHSSGGRKIPVSAADRAAAKPTTPRTRFERGEIMRTRAEAEAPRGKPRA